MSQLINEIVVHQYIKGLEGLKTIMTKAKVHADEYKFDANKYLDIKLAPDMFNFCKQIQMTTDNAKGAVARLAGVENPVFTDDEKSFEELLARVDKTIAFITKYKEDNFSNYKNQKISFPWYPGAYLNGHDYLVSFAIPNFYFHLTTSYNLLRNAGVNIGKTDYLGNLNWQK